MSYTGSTKDVMGMQESREGEVHRSRRGGFPHYTWVRSVTKARSETQRPPWWACQAITCTV